MFFGFWRGYIPPGTFEIRAYPFESIQIILQKAETKGEIIKNIVGNIIFFIPYGFLGILYTKLNSYKYLFITFFICINYLEFSQYFFSRGYAEFDDVLLNTFGMTIGYFIYKRFFFIDKQSINS